ncbi:MAG: helix-turn-helix domain-containing protein [Acidobacteriia bacterium]|nr:helix-turn-helix domain-containing protein [Terriglobia bacterium]MBZ5723053.1 helix-turn-helix domain-containing protein [Terriglobia bacterium]
MIEQLRGRIVPLNVREVADLLGVAESTVQRWVRNRELLAIRVADTIRFDPGVLADRLERFSISTVETQERTENGQGGGGLVLVSNTVDEG